MIITNDCDHGRNRCLMSCMFWICGTLNQRFVVALFSKESTNAYEIYIQLKVNAKRSLCTSWQRRNSNKSVMKVKFVCGWLLTWFISIDKNVFSLLKMCKLFENMKQVFYSPLKTINTFFERKNALMDFSVWCVSIQGVIYNEYSSYLVHTILCPDIWMLSRPVFRAANRQLLCILSPMHQSLPIGHSARVSDRRPEAFFEYRP